MFHSLEQNDIIFGPFSLSCSDRIYLIIHLTTTSLFTKTCHLLVENN